MAPSVQVRVDLPSKTISTASAMRTAIPSLMRAGLSISKESVVCQSLFSLRKPRVPTLTRSLARAGAVTTMIQRHGMISLLKTADPAVTAIPAPKTSLPPIKKSSAMVVKSSGREEPTALIVAPLTPGGSLRPSQSAAPSKLLQDFART